MLDRQDFARIQSIRQKMEYVQEIVDEFGCVADALNDRRLARPAIFMHLAAISEQMDRLQGKGYFLPKDIQGCHAMRNFIAHDYEGVNPAIVEKTLREDLPRIRRTVDELLESDF